MNDRLIYQAVPLGTELDPFLEALTLVKKNETDLPDDVREKLEVLDLPADLKLFVTDQCPFCPKTAEQIIPLVIENELIRLNIIDGFLFKELAETHNVQSAPTLILDDNFRWTGTIDIREVVEMIVNRDPEKLSPSSLENMLNEGKAFDLAKMMIEKETIFPAFVDLLIHEKWPIRLGAMVALEEINEKNMDLAAQAIRPLLEKFPEAEEQVKGDILYICGESGSKKLVPKLEKILTEDHAEDIIEAAEEAIDSIISRSSE